MDKKNKSFETLWNKIWKSFVALAVFWGWFSATGKTLQISWILSIAVSVVIITIYWHLLEKTLKFTNSVIEYFIELRKDVKFIKGQVNRGGKNDKNK